MNIMIEACEDQGHHEFFLRHLEAKSYQQGVKQNRLCISNIEMM